MNLAGPLSFPVADKAAEMGIPVLFVTGFSGDPPGRLARECVLQKPYPAEDLERAHRRATPAGTGSWLESGRTVTGTLVALVLALTLPVTAFTAFVLVRYAMEEQSRYAREAEQIAGFVGEIVDRELTNFASVLKGASTSSELLSGNLSGFYDEAVRLVAGTDNIVLLRDMGQRQLINTAQPFGAALPPAVPLTESERAALEADHPVVGGVYASPLSGELRIPVAIPVSLNNEPLVLTITVPAAYFWRVITPAAPPGGVITIGDGSGIIVGRSLDNETYAGQPALPEYLALASGDGGSFRITGLGGSVLLSGYSRSPFSNWIIGANIPINVVEAPLWSSLAGILAVALAAAVIAMVISAAFIRRFRRASPDPARPGEEHPDQWPAARHGPPGVRPDHRRPGRRAAPIATRPSGSLRERTQELEILLETVPASVWFTYDPEVLEVKSTPMPGACCGCRSTAAPPSARGLQAPPHVRGRRALPRLRASPCSAPFAARTCGTRSMNTASTRAAR